MLHSSCVLVADSPPPSSIRHFYRALSSKGRHYDPSHVAMWPCWRHAVVWLHSQQAILPEQPSWPELRGYCSQRRPQVSILPFSYLFLFCPLTGCWAHIAPLFARNNNQRLLAKMLFADAACTVYVHADPKILHFLVQWPNRGFKAQKIYCTYS